MWQFPVELSEHQIQLSEYLLQLSELLLPLSDFPIPLSECQLPLLQFLIHLSKLLIQSPVIIGGRVFVTSIEGPSKEKLHVACFDLQTGAAKWKKTFTASQPWQVTDYVSKAAPTPSADSKRIHAFFETGDLIALDHEGATIWQRSLVKEYGEFKGNHGVGTSIAQIRTRSSWQSSTMAPAISWR